MTLKSVLAAVLLIGSVGAAHGGIFDAPPGWGPFCERNPKECHFIDNSHSVIVWDKKGQKLVNRVNDMVNARVRGVADKPGNDFWRIATTEGDCEDVALAKRHEFLARGVPPSALALARVSDKRKGGNHIVLIVYTDAGSMVLDNENVFYKVVPIEQTYDAYEYRRIQNRTDHDDWTILAPLND